MSKTKIVPPHSDGEVSAPGADGGVKSPASVSYDPSVRDDAATSPDDGGGKSLSEARRQTGLTSSWRRP